jgi:hypothetical protein
LLLQGLRGSSWLGSSLPVLKEDAYEIAHSDGHIDIIKFDDVLKSIPIFIGQRSLLYAM